MKCFFHHPQLWHDDTCGYWVQSAFIIRGSCVANMAEDKDCASSYFGVVLLYHMYHNSPRQRRRKTTRTRTMKRRRQTSQRTQKRPEPRTGKP